MKRILTLVLALAIALSMAACVAQKPAATPTPQEPAAPVEPAAPTTPADPAASAEPAAPATPDAGVEYPEMTIKLAHDAPLETPHHEACLNIKQEIEERTGGKITIEIYPLQQLGSAREMIESMQMNSIEMVLLPTSKYGGFYPTLNIMDMPFLFPTEESTMKLFKDPLAKEIMAGLENIGIHGNAFYSSGFKNFTNNREIRKPEDFQGLKIRTQEAPIIMEMYKAWGASPVAIDIMELYNALQQKTVDGQENPYLSIASLKLFEVQDYMAISKHSYLEYIMCSSKKWWDGLDANTQALFTEVIDKNQQFCYDRLQEYNKQYLDTIKAGKITVYELTPEEREAFRVASAPVYEKFAAEIGPEVLTKVQEFLAKPENQ